ncbi:MAG: peptidoglycan-binding protein [Clostridia bacterium]|nr:peptidoglycan-binding protein [Clostridia bacterium]
MELLRFGQRGPLVEYLQLSLSRAGYDPGSIDGIFGRKTLSALESFQRRYQLEPDGIVGRLTRARLFPYLTGYTLTLSQPGDTLDSISARFSVPSDHLIRSNPDLPAGSLPAGTLVIIPLPFPVVSDQVHYSYLYTMLVLHGLSVRYPFILLNNEGSSVMGRRLISARIGEGSNEVFYNASHHANEWITTPVLLKFLEEYAEAYSNHEMIADVPAKTAFENTTLYVMPLVNPDGVDLVTGMLADTDSYYLQAQALSSFYPNIPFPSGWKANISGVDLNLGYPAGWEEARRIKFSQGFTRPGPRDYVGIAPLQEPENQAVARFTQAHDFSLTLSYHTQGKVIFWKFQDYEPAGSRGIGEAFAQVSGYALSDTPYESAFAGYKDWFIQAYNRPGYTVEAGLGSNPLPLAQFPEIYRDNLGILALGMVLTKANVVY